MSTVLEVDDTGTLKVPPTMLPVAVPRTRYIASNEGHQLVLAPAADEQPFWQTASPAERLQALQAWLAKVKTNAGLSDYAVSRDSIYD